MRAEGATQERVYRALKKDLFAGTFQLRARIDLKTITDRYNASRTPVREAIFRLVGEKLLGPHPDGGFQLRLPDSNHLADLYAWNLHQLLAALDVAADAALSDALAPFEDRIVTTGSDAQVPLVAGFFAAIAAATGNVEFVDQIAAASNRLHIPRLAEAVVFADLAKDVANLLRVSARDPRRTARRRIVAYHRRRIDDAARIAMIWSRIEHSA